MLVHSPFLAVAGPIYHELIAIPFFSGLKSISSSIYGYFNKKALMCEYICSFPPLTQLQKSHLVAYLYGLYGNKKRPIITISQSSYTHSMIRQIGQLYINPSLINPVIDRLVGNPNHMGNLFRGPLLDLNFSSIKCLKFLVSEDFHPR